MNGRLLRPILLLVLLVQSVGILGQVESAVRADDGWTLGPRKHLRSGVDLWPQITAPSNAATRKVNAVLRQMNHDVVEAVRQCDDDWATFQKATGTKKRGAERGDWEQKIKVTMNGPRFLSFTATDSNYCGGAYPNMDRLAFVFDMQSGEFVDWTKFISESAGVARSDHVFAFPALQEINSHSAVGDCKNAFEGEQYFLIWPDARRDALVALATGLPHVIQGCAEEIVLSMERARQIGFDEEVLHAIDEAHRRSRAMTHAGQSNRRPTK